MLIFQRHSQADIRGKVRALLTGLDVNKAHDLEARGQKVRRLILGAEFPPPLAAAIVDNYARLCVEFGVDAVDTAVRSSATAEDLPTASFAGQQESRCPAAAAAPVVLAVRRALVDM